MQPPDSCAKIRYDGKVSVTDILKKAGNPLSNADLSKSQIIREDGEVVLVDLEAILQGKQPSVDLQPGDTLFIPLK